MRMLIYLKHVCGSLIEKLPESWKDYKNNMKHKRKQMSLEDLIVHIRIEEKNCMQDKVIKAKEISSKANAIEGKSSKHYNKSKFSNAKHDNRSQPKHENKFRSTNNWSNFKKKGSCFVCGKPRHHAHECRHRMRDNNPARANVVEADDIIVAVISEINVEAKYLTLGQIIRPINLGII
ncbi:unnamed protein product [Prunus armeniaca]